MERNCGECNLCCTLVPVEELKKKGGERCKHQTDNLEGGCGIYVNRPLSCRMYYCGWMIRPWFKGLKRPNESHYVLHPNPDTIRLHFDGKYTNMPALVVWVDPKYPDAYKDPKLLYVINKNKFIAKICYGSTEAKVLIPPSLSGRDWVEHPVIIDWNEPYAQMAIREGLV